MNQEKKAPKKTLTSIIAALVAVVLFLVGQQLGILPASEDEQPVSNTAVTGQTQQPSEDAAPEEQQPAADAADAGQTQQTTEAPITEPQAIVNYLAAHGGKLPDNFLTKREAEALGWDSSKNYVGDVAPGKSIGGDRFGNYEGLLPAASGRTYHEADCYYTGGARNAYRLVYSTAGLYFYTEDHYQTFTEMFPED